MSILKNKIGGGSFSARRKEAGTVIGLSPRLPKGGLRRKGGDSPWL